jgi:hypothetical protein
MNGSRLGVRKSPAAHESIILRTLMMGSALESAP